MDLFLYFFEKCKGFLLRIKEVGQKKKGIYHVSIVEIKDLHVEIEGKEIFSGVNLISSKTGEIAAIMGPMVPVNQTLSAAIMGNLTMKSPKVRSCLMA